MAQGRAIARSVAPQACFSRRISRIRRIDTLLAGIGSSSSKREGPLRSPAVERSPPHRVADFILERWPTSNRNRWPSSSRNPWPTSLGISTYVDLESRVRSDHPLRPIRRIVNEALLTLGADFEAIYAAGVGRPSIPPERLLRAPTRPAAPLTRFSSSC